MPIGAPPPGLNHHSDRDNRFCFDDNLRPFKARGIAAMSGIRNPDYPHCSSVPYRVLNSAILSPFVSVLSAPSLNFAEDTARVAVRRSD